MKDLNTKMEMLSRFTFKENLEFYRQDVMYFILSTLALICYSVKVVCVYFYEKSLTISKSMIEKIKNKFTKK